MFLSGIVKLASHDPTWRDWTALEYHYQTQPLPTWTSWYIHQMPAGFHWLSVGFMFFAELVAPFFMFGPRPIRLAGFAQPRVAAVADRGDRKLRVFQPAGDRHLFCILDDRDWEWVKRMRTAVKLRARRRLAMVFRAARGYPWSWPRRLAVGVVGCGILTVTATQTLETVAPDW